MQTKVYKYSIKLLQTAHNKITTILEVFFLTALIQYFIYVNLLMMQDICGVQGPVLVAVKTLTSRNPKDISRFSEEVQLMKRFIHPNIVSLLGMCPHYMITE